MSIKLQKDLEDLTERSETSNPQTIFLRYKEDIKEMAITQAKAAVPTRKQMIKRLKEAKATVENYPWLEDEKT